MRIQNPTAVQQNKRRRKKMMPSRTPRRKRQSEPSGAENATTRTLEKGAAAPAGSKGSEAAK